MCGLRSLGSLTPLPLYGTTATVSPILHQGRHQGKYQPRGCQVFAHVSRSSRGKKSSFCDQILAALPGLILNITGQPTVPSSEADMAACMAPQTSWTSCLSARQQSAGASVSDLAGGQWYPESLSFDFRHLYWRHLEFLRYHQGLLKYLHLFSLSIYSETEKDQSVNVRSKQMKRTSTKQGLCCATLANPWLKIQIELTIVICWARCYHSGHKHSRHTWNGGYPFCILSKHIRITPTH